jgi:hypothetical protein
MGKHLSEQVAAEMRDYSGYLPIETIKEIAELQAELYEAERQLTAVTAPLRAEDLIREMQRETDRLQTLLQEYGNG